MRRRVTQDGRVLLLTLFLSGSAIALPPQRPPAAGETAATVASPDGDAGLPTELEQLAGELMIPVEGVTAADLRDNFSEMRAGACHASR
jgi:hypothetical protein